MELLELYRGEHLIYSRPVWETASTVELATMGWVNWWNTQRLHEALDYRTRDRLTTERNPGRFIPSPHTQDGPGGQARPRGSLDLTHKQTAHERVSHVPHH